MLALILSERTAPVTRGVSLPSDTLHYIQSDFFGIKSDHDTFLLKTHFSEKSKSMINTKVLLLWNGTGSLAFYSMHFFTTWFFLTMKYGFVFFFPIHVNKDKDFQEENMFNEHPLFLTAGDKSPCAPPWTLPRTFFFRTAVLCHMAPVHTVGSSMRESSILNFVQFSRPLVMWFPCVRTFFKTQVVSPLL